jgi:hypothetical protein
MGETSSIVVEFKLVAAQADGVVLDLHSVAHIRDHAHVTAFLVLTRSRKVLSRTTDARRKAWGTASGECRICPAAVRLSALFTVLGVNQGSCALPGNCAATGNYTGAQDHNQAFVADEKIGTWGGAIEVPGSGALNGFDRAQVLSISCPSAGNCAAGGSYITPDNVRLAFVSTR